MKQSLLRWLLLVAIFVSACTTDPTGGDMDSTPTPEPTSHKVSVEQALSELEAVLVQIDQNGNDQTRSSIRSVASVATIHADNVFTATRSADAPDVEELVYIANFANDQGYAVLAADDRLAPVIAITEQGSLTAEQFAAIAHGNYELNGTTPPPIFGDAVAYAMRIGTIGGGIGGGGIGGGNLPITPGIDTGGGLPPTIRTETYYCPWYVASIIGPFMPMRWGQSEPYNKYAVDIYGQKCPAGCVAVAVSQIVASNRYRFKRNEYSIWDYGFHTVDYRVIFNRFDQGKALLGRTETNSPAAVMMARLIGGIGEEVGTKYATSDVGGSSSNIVNAKEFLTKIGYKDVKKWDYSLTYVDRMVRERSMPIYVRGNCGDKGHAWIIDGIMYQNRTVQTRIAGTESVVDSRTESRALLHCNFGWGGLCDGYYLTDMFDNTKEGPTTTGPGDLGGRGTSCYTTQKKCLTYTTAW